MLFECTQKQHPRWWAAMVFLAPVTFPYFIFKSRKAQGMLLYVLFLITFFGVMVSEVYIYSSRKEKHWIGNQAPIIRQAIQLGDSLKQTTADLDQALAALEQLSKVSSRITEIKQTLEFIKTLKKLMYENQTIIDKLVTHARLYHAYFERKELNWVLQIDLFYHHRKVLIHGKSLKTYVDDFEALLRYSHDNFLGITVLKTQEYLNNYDEYYLRYRRALDAHTRFNLQRIEFQREFLLKYPELNAYLPGDRHTEIFRLWE